MGHLDRNLGLKQYDDKRDIKSFVLGYPHSFRYVLDKLASLMTESQFPLLLVHTYLPKNEAETEANQKIVKFLAGHKTLPFRVLDDLVASLENQ